MGLFDGFLSIIRLNDDYDDDEEYDDDDLEEYDEDDEDFEEDRPKRGFLKRLLGKSSDDEEDEDEISDEDGEEDDYYSESRVKKKRKKLFGSNKPSDDEYEEEYGSLDAVEEEESVKKSRSKSSASKKAAKKDQTFMETGFQSNSARSSYTASQPYANRAAGMEYSFDYDRLSHSFGTSANRETAFRGRSNRRRQPSDRFPNVQVIRPESMEDTQDIAETLMAKATVVLNLEGIDVDTAQRIIDFSCGACYSLNGGLQKVSSYFYILTPSNVKISGDFTDMLNGSFDFPSMKQQY
ncbi:MAG: cell division protein SepF [Lachnospiraceae bacterium]|nr:cell division protein SepF [Lachnospiraceae bacterium]